MIYRYAYDENGNLVEIDSVERASHLGRRFKCISCGQIMIARIGDEKEPHFAHLATDDDKKCNNESYLHSLTKKMLLRAWNDKSGSFICNTTIIYTCENNEDCDFRKEYFPAIKCQSEGKEQVNLYKYYDTIQEEGHEKGKIADLILSSKTHPAREHLALEVHCTHKVDEDKIASGLKMIEFDIHSEDDIQRILKNGFCGDNVKSLNIHYHNFRNKKKNDKILHKSIEAPQNHYRFILYQSGAARIVFPQKRTISCRFDFQNDQIQTDKYSIIELDIYKNDMNFHDCLILGLVKCRQIGIVRRNCYLCNYVVSNNPHETELFCNAYKKYGTPRNPNQKDACACEKWWENMTLIKRFSILLNTTHIDIIKNTES